MTPYGGTRMAQIARERDEALREAEHLRAALQEAHRQLSRFEDKGPKQVGRAMLTIEQAIASPE